MIPHTDAERADLRTFRTTIETVTSQTKAMGVECLHTRTNAGFDVKVRASMLALMRTNMNWQSRSTMARLVTMFGVDERG
ncbi:MAG: hypothetical protein M3Y74_22075 [Chloroflexota bacterium]|nr:hypothetical protein [Chloroflexota bacterium]